MKDVFKEKDVFKNFGLSFVLHVIFFLVLSFLGIFSSNNAALQPADVIDVTVYDASDKPPAGSPAPEMNTEVAPPPQNFQSEVKIQDKTLPKEKIQKQPTKPTPNATPKNSGKVTSSQAGANGNGLGTGQGTGTGDGNGRGSAFQPKEPPQLISMVKPIYPKELRVKNVEGVVRVQLLVNEKGRVESVEVVQSSGYPDMDSEAIKAARQYRFRAAKNQLNKPVACFITTSIRFKLN